MEKGSRQKKRGVATRHEARYTVISTRLSREEWISLKKAVRRQRTSVASLLRVAVNQLLAEGGVIPPIPEHQSGRS